MCIYNHFKKSKVPKCPVCGEMIEKNFTKSVRRDPYKQSLVDLIHPEYHEQDLQIIKRCRLLFPDFDIQTIKDELDSSSCKEYIFFFKYRGFLSQKEKETDLRKQAQTQFK